MTTIKEKSARLAAAHRKVEELIDAGSDLKSSDAVPVGPELENAYSELAKEFAREIPTPIAESHFTINPKRSIILE